MPEELFESSRTLDESSLVEEIKKFYSEYSKAYNQKPKSSKKKKTDKESKKKKITKIDENFKISGDRFFLQDSQSYSLVSGFLDKNGKKSYTESIRLPIYYPIDAVIDDFKNIIEIEKQMILEDLSYNEIDSAPLSLQYIKDLSEITDTIEKIQKEMINKTQLKYNILFQKETDLLKLEKSQLMKQDMENYMYSHVSLMNQNKKDGSQIIQKGTQAIYEDSQGTIIDFIPPNYIIRLNDSLDEITVPLSKLKIIPGIRNSILEIKGKKSLLTIQIKDVLLKLDPKYYDIFLKTLMINLSSEDILNRPRLDTSKEYDPNILVTKKQILDDWDKHYYTVHKKYLYNMKNIVTIGNRKETNIDTITLSSKCKSLLSMKDNTNPFEIDDFKFQSIIHYHLASQFYNRQDLPDDIRQEYNDFFTKFTLDYKGSDSLAKLTPKEILRNIQMTKFRRADNWNTGNPSNRDIYLLKAYYHKYANNEILKDCLKKTGDAKILERIKRGLYRINYELMEIRYYINNDITPNYYDYNYSSRVRLDFDKNYENLRDKSSLILIELAIQKQTWQNRYKEIDNPLGNFLISYQSISGGILPDVDILYKIFYSYQGDYIYNIVEKYPNSSLEKILSMHHELESDLDMFVFIYSIYQGTMIIEKKKQRELEKDIYEAESISVSDTEKLAKERFNELKAKVKAQGYHIINIPPIKNTSIYESIITNMISQDKYPFNIDNVLDTRKKYPRETENIRLGTNEYKIHKNGIDKLRMDIADLFGFNRKGEDDIEMNIRTGEDVDNQILLSLMSRHLGANITVLGNDGIKEFAYYNSRKLWPISIEGNDWLEVRANIVLVEKETGIYLSTEPDQLQKDAYYEYLWDLETNVLLKEMDDDTQEYFGTWDPIEYQIHYEDFDIDAFMANREESLDMEVIRFYSIQDRWYFNNTQIV